MIDLREWAKKEDGGGVMYPEGCDLENGVVALDRWLSDASRRVKVRKAKHLISVLLKNDQWREVVDKTSQPHMFAIELLTSTMPGWPSEDGLEILRAWLGVKYPKLQPYQALPLFVDAMFGENFRLMSEGVLSMTGAKWTWLETFEAIKSLRPEFELGLMGTSAGSRADLPSAEVLELPVLDAAP